MQLVMFYCISFSFSFFFPLSYLCLWPYRQKLEDTCSSKPVRGEDKGTQWAITIGRDNVQLQGRKPWLPWLRQGCVWWGIWVGQSSADAGAQGGHWGRGLLPRPCGHLSSSTRHCIHAPGKIKGQDENGGDTTAEGSPLSLAPVCNQPARMYSHGYL